ncbi:uncharacterized protein LOC132721441 [Ruditapes philippinarum]|uniref:uncharacterized protein LOC132721441 n=1 Tax=Ruditapes philippinarum TaxID=129788 RepID=UPI00295AE999|nr:uncharacterized protein LOC132721441 [Ruditapes philippinarum]
MGSSLSSSGNLTATDVQRAVGSQRTNLSKDDAKLLQHTLSTIPSMGNLSSCEVVIEFVDTYKVSVSTKNLPTERLVFGIVKGKPDYHWERKSFSRSCGQFFTDSIPSLVSSIFGIIGASLRKSITY